MNEEIQSILKTSIGELELHSFTVLEFKEIQNYFKLPEKEQSENGLLDRIIDLTICSTDKKTLDHSKLADVDREAIAEEFLSNNSYLKGEVETVEVKDPNVIATRKPQPELQKRNKESHVSHLYRVIKVQHDQSQKFISSFKSFSNKTKRKMARSIQSSRGLAQHVVVKNPPYIVSGLPPKNESTESKKLDRLLSTNSDIAAALHDMNEFQVSSADEMKETEEENKKLNKFSITLAKISLVFAGIAIILSIIFSIISIRVTINESRSTTIDIVNAVDETKSSVNTHLDSLISIQKKLLANGQTTSPKETVDSSVQNQDEFIKQTNLIIKRLEHMSQHLHNIDKKSH